MNAGTKEDGIEIVIEGGTKNEQYLVGVVVGKAMAQAGFTNAIHVLDSGAEVTPGVQLSMYPSLLEKIREGRPDFLNTPVIVSAYHAPSVPVERRARDRLNDAALELATSFVEPDISFDDDGEDDVYVAEMVDGELLEE